MLSGNFVLLIKVFPNLIISIYSKFYQHINKGIKIETDK